MDDVIIRASHLTKDYGGGRGIFDIDLEVKKGEVFGFVGTNGSGKTTTIRSLMGFIKPDGGSSAVGDLDSWQSSAKIMQSVSYIPGEIAFPALATGTEFLKSQAGYMGVTDFTYMNQVIEKLQLDPTARLKRMSKGMKQKTAIVAALMGEKEILVLDEPTTGLDPLMRDAFLDLIRAEREKGHTIFMSSHIFEEIEAVCDRVAMIKNGHLIQVSSLYDLRHPTTKEFVVSFASGEERNRFAQNKQFAVECLNGNACHIKLPVEQLSLLFQELKTCQIAGLHEQHLSLQEEFMNAYKGESYHGNN